jgi:hypothetical protein
LQKIPGPGELSEKAQTDWNAKSISVEVKKFIDLTSKHLWLVDDSTARAHFVKYGAMAYKFFHGESANISSMLSISESTGNVTKHLNDT